MGLGVGPGSTLVHKCDRGGGGKRCRRWLHIRVGRDGRAWVTPITAEQAETYLLGFRRPVRIRLPRPR
jgi:hypothetical protein